jgi:hypothetical protein
MLVNCPEAADRFVDSCAEAPLNHVALTLVAPRLVICPVAPDMLVKYSVVPDNNGVAIEAPDIQVADTFVALTFPDTVVITPIVPEIFVKNSVVPDSSGVPIDAPEIQVALMLVAFRFPLSVVKFAFVPLRVVICIEVNDPTMPPYNEDIVIDAIEVAAFVPDIPEYPE